MKYKVIGWTFYDDNNIQDAPLTFASRQAIVDEIKEKNYLFSGYDHQECSFGCPVLNDGKKRVCSQRGFAGIMAEARGETEPYSYAKYMFAIKEEAKIKPKSTINYQEILPINLLRETFNLQVTPEEFFKAEKESFILLKDLEQLRYIEPLDIIIFKNNQNELVCEVTDVDRCKNISTEELLEIFNSNKEINKETLLQLKLKIINN